MHVVAGFFPNNAFKQTNPEINLFKISMTLYCKCICILHVRDV